MKSPPWLANHLLIVLCFICLPGTFVRLGHAVAPFTTSDLQTHLDNALEKARRHMGRTAPPIPPPFSIGGGCYTGFGTSLNVQDCRTALGQMPSNNLDPHDIQITGTGHWIARIFDYDHPLLWKYNRCLIGVSLYDTTRTRGLYPAFRNAAGAIVDGCVARSTGGLVRFAHFEVVVFEDSLLPRQTPDYVFDFLNDPGNLPLSAGLERLWRERTQ